MNKVYRRRKLTLEFEVTEFGPEIGDEFVQDHLKTVMEDWRDGRYPLSVELFKKGLSEIVSLAIQEAVYAKISRESAHEMVPNRSGTGAISKHVLLKSRACRDLSVDSVQFNSCGIETIHVEADKDDPFPEVS